MTLMGRRKRFEDNNYISKNRKLIANHLLYKEFYTLVDVLQCDFIKVKAHKKESTKNEIDNIFSLVDKQSRDALRAFLCSNG